MAKKYTKEQAERALGFWQNVLNEAVAAESEEDQAKEQEGAGEADSKDAEIEELKAKVAELEAQLAAKDGDAEGSDDAAADEDSGEADDDASEEGAEEEGSEGDSEGADDEASDEDDTEEEEASDEDDSEEDDSEEEEIDEAAPGSARFAPNTVGAVCELLKKSDPNDELLIQLLPGKEQCMITDIDRKITMNGGFTYMTIGRGKPLAEGCCKGKKPCKK